MSDPGEVVTQRRKRRNRPHIMEEESVQILRTHVPPEWVLHDYRPDYGVDLSLEVFQPLKDEPGTSETLGEHLLVQMKAVETVKITDHRVYALPNAKKSAPKPDKEDYADIKALKFVIDVCDLETTAAMGIGTPLVLIVTALDTKAQYFVCLNDLLDKVVAREDPLYHQQDTKTIWLPARNVIDSDRFSQAALRWYAQRSKILAAFAKCEYQRNELRHAGAATPHEQLEVASMFAARLLELDIWNTCSWKFFRDYGMELRIVAATLKKALIEMTSEEDMLTLMSKCHALWANLASLVHMFEDICREWYLPTLLGALT